MVLSDRAGLVTDGVNSNISEPVNNNINSLHYILLMSMEFVLIRTCIYYKIYLENMTSSKPKNPFNNLSAIKVYIEKEYIYTHINNLLSNFYTMQ